MTTDALAVDVQIPAYSTRSAWLSGLGFCMVLAAFAYSAHELTTLQGEIVQAKDQLAATEQMTVAVQDDLTTLRRQLADSREAVRWVTQGINLYHQGKYVSAITAYQRALELDPNNPYIANLKGYSEFKAGRLAESTKSLTRSVEIDSGYAWGYFDLARVLCADKKFPEAKAAADKAVELRSEMKAVMTTDGEFSRLCRPITSAKD